MGEPVEIKVAEIGLDELGKIACWLADGTVGANLAFSIEQEDSDFTTARNVNIKISNPTLLTVESLKSLIKASFMQKSEFQEINN